MRRSKKTGAGASGMERFSEPFPPHGALAAEGAENLLGRPRLDPLVVLVREAVQNSWDARREDTTRVTFRVDAHHLQTDQRREVTERVFRDPPKAAARLRTVLGRDDILLLSLTDTGTTGLAGPTRADRPPGRREPSNFVDLLFNVGQPSERDFGGGTYGFGRTISFVVSEARAILVHSRTTTRRTLESRFIAAAFSDHYVEQKRRFTGRHWWGRAATDSVEPIVGDAADEIAAALGLPGFAPDQTGTTICVVAPDLQGRDARQAARFMAGALTWNFWPKMVDHDDLGRSMRFAVSIDGEPIAVPEPDDLAPLPAFVSCLRAVHAADAPQDTRLEPPDTAANVSLEEVISPRTAERIGWLALAHGPVLPRPIVDEGEDEEAERGPSAAFTGPAHHVALLRQPELIVEYLSTAELRSVSSEYVGVFKPVKELDRAFARAEPPTHDAWNPNLVAETKLRRYVAVALRAIRESTRRYAKKPIGFDDGRSVARITEALGPLFGPSVSDPDLAARRGPVVEIGAVRLVADGDHRVSEVTFSVQHADDTRGTAIDATAHAATHDGWTLERGKGDADAASRDGVEVLGFTDQQDVPWPGGDRLVVLRGDATTWRVRVRARAGVSVGVDLQPNIVGEGEA